MSEETTVVDTTTEETTDTTNEKYSIETETLTEFGNLCRILTGRTDTSLSQEDYYFNIIDMKDVLSWAQNEAITQQDLIDQIINTYSQQHNLPEAEKASFGNDNLEESLTFNEDVSTGEGYNGSGTIQLGYSFLSGESFNIVGIRFIGHHVNDILSLEIQDEYENILYAGSIKGSQKKWVELRFDEAIRVYKDKIYKVWNRSTWYPPRMTINNISSKLLNLSSLRYNVKTNILQESLVTLPGSIAPINLIIEPFSEPLPSEYYIHRKTLDKIAQEVQRIDNYNTKISLSSIISKLQTVNKNYIGKIPFIQGQIQSAPPYINTSQTNRISYNGFDIVPLLGEKYQLIGFNSKGSKNVEYGIQYLTTQGLIQAKANLPLSNEHKIDLGWQKDGYIFTTPEDVGCIWITAHYINNEDITTDDLDLSYFLKVYKE